MADNRRNGNRPQQGKAPQNSAKPVRKAAPQSKNVQRSPQPAPQQRRPQQGVPKSGQRQAPPVKKQPVNQSAPRNTNPPAPSRRPPDSSRSREAERAAKRAMEQKTTVSRKRRRGGDYRYYWMLFGIFALIVFVILANTVLFNCAEIETEGSVRYSSEEIISASGLKIGDNLLKVNKTKSAQAVVASLNYIDTAQVTKIFPTKLKITVVEAEKWFIVSEGGVDAAISRAGRIIDRTNENGLVRVIGYEPETLDAGGWLKSTVSGKTDIPAEILTAADKVGFTRLTEIDITDRFSITAKCGDNITLKLGNISEITSKLSAAKQIIDTEVAAGAEVIIMLENPDKVALKHVVNDPVPIAPTAESTAEASAEPEETPE